MYWGTKIGVGRVTYTFAVVNKNKKNRTNFGVIINIKYTVRSTHCFHVEGAAEGVWSKGAAEGVWSFFLPRLWLAGHKKVTTPAQSPWQPTCIEMYC